MEGILAFEDGTILHGRGFGHEGWVAAELCFNTSMTGYQEILTDPSYRGQIVALTCPEIGNTGINPEDEESDRPQVSGLLVRRLSTRGSSWRERETLDVYLRRHKVLDTKVTYLGGNERSLGESRNEAGRGGAEGKRVGWVRGKGLCGGGNVH